LDDIDVFVNFEEAAILRDAIKELDRQDLENKII